MSVVVCLIVLIAALLTIWLVQSMPIPKRMGETPIDIIRWALTAVVVVALIGWLLSTAGITSCEHVRFK